MKAGECYNWINKVFIKVRAWIRARQPSNKNQGEKT